MLFWASLQNVAHSIASLFFVVHFLLSAKYFLWHFFRLLIKKFHFFTRFPSSGRIEKWPFQHNNVTNGTMTPTYKLGSGKYPSEKETPRYSSWMAFYSNETLCAHSLPKKKLFLHRWKSIFCPFMKHAIEFWVDPELFKLTTHTLWHTQKKKQWNHFSLHKKAIFELVNAALNRWLTTKMHFISPSAIFLRR